MIVGPDVTSLGLREAGRRASANDGYARLVKETVAGFETALARVYHAGAAVGDGDDTLFDLEDGGAGETRQRDLLDEAGEAPVIQLVNQLLLRAVTAGASDLHIEPYEDGLRARMRVGVMRACV